MLTFPYSLCLLIFMFTYVYGLYFVFLIHSSCASLVVTNKINANSPSLYLTYYKHITQQLYCSLSRIYYYTKLENLSSVCVFPPHILMCLLLSTTKFSICRSRVLGYLYECTIYTAIREDFPWFENLTL
jgi:hypothetical protein